ncbi:MAG: hypothetical protein HYX87_00620 [Chloroflexi bacterium]|nr:hypothetical protein [Chloroflexota bacterium]
MIFGGKVRDELLTTTSGMLYFSSRLSAPASRSSLREGWSGDKVGGRRSNPWPKFYSATMI